ncbi:helix-turn-helix domain-containing protein [Streptomyces sp. NPDC002306]
MGRPKSPLSGDGPVVEFAQRLRLLRELAGSPPYEDMAEQCSFSAPTLARADQGRSVPRWDVAVAYVQACAADEHHMRELNRLWRAAFPHPGGRIPRWTAPDGIDQLAQLIETMHYLWMGCGYPSLRDLCRRSAARVGSEASLVRSTLNDVLRGARLPSCDLLLGYVAVCAADADEGAYAHYSTDAWTGAWRRATGGEGGRRSDGPPDPPGLLPAGSLPFTIPHHAVSTGHKRLVAGSRRQISAPSVAPGPLRELKDLLYQVYLAAGAPTLSDIAGDIANDDTLAGAPSRDTIHRVLSAPELPRLQADALAVAVTLARRAAWDPVATEARVGDLWVAARLAPPSPGLPVEEADPLALEVHPASWPGARTKYAETLPPYVMRDFDIELNRIAARAAAGRSSMVTLVGSASSGKTRASWEATRILPDGWKIWHPIDPTRQEAALAEIDSIEPRTVVWLNEAHHYLGDGEGGERLAAALRTVLNTPRRAPVLVLATLWPEHWEELTTRRDPDRHAQARALLTEQPRVSVPDGFAPADRERLAASVELDERLRDAANRAQDGRVTQYLAGVPVLLNRYADAPPAARALVSAAMDAIRLGADPRLPLSWLADCAPGYLTDFEWDALTADWLPQSLAYATQPCNGLPGMLMPVRPHPRTAQMPVGNDRSSVQTLRQNAGPMFQLADYLEYLGREERADLVPPIDFWTAAAAHAHNTDLARLADAAWSLGLHRDAAQLYRKGSAAGSSYASAQLIRLITTLDPSDKRAAQWGTAHASLDDPEGVANLLDSLHQTGAHDQTAQLLARNPAAHVSLDNPAAAADLLNALHTTGAEEQASVLATRIAAFAPLDDPEGVANLLDSLHQTGAHDQTAQLLARNPAAHVSLDNPAAAADLLNALHTTGAEEQASVLATRYAHSAGAAQLPTVSPVSRPEERRRPWSAQPQPSVPFAPPAAKHGSYPSEQFRFGREPDGSPASPWSWDDLD